MLRGSQPAKIDDKGRLKIPAGFRGVIEPRYGRDFFVTSFRGDSARIYPIEVYAAFEERLRQSSQVEPLVDRLRNAVNYYGQAAVMDGQGRVPIHSLLREKVGIDGEVIVVGHQDFLRVWNREAFEEQQKPFTDDELRGLAALGF